jgi:hypothetical protein
MVLGMAAGAKERNAKQASLSNDRIEVCHELYLIQKNQVR